MSEYNFLQTDSGFIVLKDKMIYASGKVVLTFSTYSFEFCDKSDSQYEMKSSGLFFWRKTALYKNGVLVEEYSSKKAKRSNISFDARSFIREQGKYIHHIDLQNEKQDIGRCLYSWSGTPAEIETQVICLVILRYINSQQKIYASAMPSA